MSSQAPPPPPDAAANRLPKILLIGTAVFVALAAVAVFFLVRMGAERSEADSTQSIESQSVTVSEDEIVRIQKEPPAAPRRRGR